MSRTWLQVVRADDHGVVTGVFRFHIRRELDCPSCAGCGCWQLGGRDVVGVVLLRPINDNRLYLLQRQPAAFTSTVGRRFVDVQLCLRCGVGCPGDVVSVVGGGFVYV